MQLAAFKNRVPQRHNENGYALGGWVSRQRQNKDTLSLEQRGRLDELGFIWDQLESDWGEGFKYLKSLSPVPTTKEKKPTNTAISINGDEELTMIGKSVTRSRCANVHTKSYPIITGRSFDLRSAANSQATELQYVRRFTLRSRK